MGTANKSNVTLRSDKASPLTREEMDGNFSELENVIDDASNNEQGLQNHENASDPHPQYATDTKVEQLNQDTNQRIDALDFSTVSDVQSSHIPPEIDSIRTSGLYSLGDGGEALYVVGDEGPGAIQSGDGRWWEPVDPVLANIQLSFADRFQEPEPEFSYTAWPFDTLIYDSVRDKVIQIYTAGTGHTADDNHLFMREVINRDIAPRFGDRKLVFAPDPLGVRCVGACVAPNGDYIATAVVTEKSPEGGLNNVNDLLFRSTDGGNSWSSETFLTDQGETPVSPSSSGEVIGGMFVTSKGTILAFCDQNSSSYVLRTTSASGENGTWSKTPIIRNYSTIGMEGAFYECEDGTIVCIIRTHPNSDSPSFSISPDDGVTWTAAEATNASWSWEAPHAIKRRPGSTMIDIFGSSRRDHGDGFGRLFHSVTTEAQLKVGDLGKPRVITYGAAALDFGYVAAVYDSNRRLYLTFYDGVESNTRINLFYGDAGTPGGVEGSASGRRDLLPPIETASSSTVGPTGDFPTLRAALEYLSRRSLIYTGPKRMRWRLILQSGVVLNEQIHISEGMNLGHIHIDSQDSEVDVDFSSFTNNFQYADYSIGSVPFMVVSQGATGPKINTVFKAIGTMPNSAAGFAVLGPGASQEFGASGGFNGNGKTIKCLFVGAGGRVYGNASTFKNGRVNVDSEAGGTIIIPGADLTNASLVGAISNSSFVDIRGADLSGSHEGMWAEDSGTLLADNVTCPNCSSDTLTVRRSYATCQGADLSGSGGTALLLHDGATALARDANLSGASAAGVRAWAGSRAVVTSANCRNGATDSSNDIQCLDGSIIHAANAIGGTNFARNTINPSGNGMILGNAP